ncbi:alpha-N-arabinofuranosidase [Asticcacaulis tiandongensis]|uniref:arabinosylfuranosidase ArfA n=1 Tax=Asticcacaulis tiandongensis TaxID=2565365 RepID=UPI00112C2DEE|nr:alpha-N-arabinofuranosidase [Asticcacaulis tiandongensis]
MTLKASVIADRDFIVDKLDRRLFGTFVEHMGRCVYGGIYEPGHATADEHGFRQDVLELTKELGPTIVRYPGGNFLSGYDWEDGVGPKENRPVKLDLAWHSTETNQFGTNEFMTWIRKADIEPMFAVNLGTRGPDEARHFLEYCNHPGGTYYSDLRISHGFKEPHDIKFWCLGNEMDGPWQICAKTAHEYGRLAQETGKVMKWVDPSVELTACGSSQRLMPTYARWEYEVLDTCFEQVDYISLHHYMRNDGNDIKEFFAEVEALDYFIKEVAAIADAVAATRRSKKRIMLSLDEWNVWYKAHGPDDVKKPGWPEAPPLLEEIYNFEDALVLGGALIVMMNNADRLKAGCLAQLVNVIGPIMTETGGPAWRQTIFHPFADATKYGRGEVLRLKVDTTTFETKSQGAIPHLLTAAVFDPETGAVSVFALNRSTDEEMNLSVDLRGLGAGLKLEAATELHHADLKAVNTKGAETIRPAAHPAAKIDGQQFTATLKPQSWNVFSLRV